MRPGPAGSVPLAYLLLGSVAAVYAWAVVVLTYNHPGTIGPNYNAPGTDYMVFHTAAALALRGDLAKLYNPDAFTALLNQTYHGYLSAQLEFRPWIYPPSFLLPLLPFSAFGFPLAFWLFQAVTGVAMIAGLRAALGPRAGWVCAAALACPAASICFVSGQCSFLIVALLAGGVGLLDRRPTLAGVLLGLLSCKPQFFVLVPVLLAARMSWRAAVAAAATCVVMALASLVWFGPAIWTGWFDAMAQSASGSDERWFLLGRLWGVSVYACAYLLSASPGVAGMAQAGAIILGVCCVWCAFRTPMPAASRAAVMLAAALLVAPHAGGYDLVLLVAACGLFLSQPGTHADNRDSLLCLAVWLGPLLGLPIISVFGRFVPLLTFALVIRVLWHAGAVQRFATLAPQPDAAAGR